MTGIISWKQLVLTKFFYIYGTFGPWINGIYFVISFINFILHLRCEDADGRELSKIHMIISSILFASSLIVHFVCL